MSTITTLHRQTFRSGSKTYYNSSRFFPETVKQDVFILYGFVRVADDFVDETPQDSSGFRAFVADYRRAVGGETIGDEIIDPFVAQSKRLGFDPAWTDAFLYSMELDLTKDTYRTLDETLEYIYGSAEVIGLFMAKILGLDEKAYRFAQLQGRAMQYINFIRDLDEDRTLGRTYLPVEESGIETLSESAARANPDRFIAFIRKQLERYETWQREAEEGYHYIPRRYRIPIKTASDMYGWTAHRIWANPFLVFEGQLKPSKSRILLQALGNLFGA